MIRPNDFARLWADTGDEVLGAVRAVGETGWYVLGAEVRVPTLGGAPVTLRVPAGTPTGRVLRVRGRGAPKPGGGTGDLLVTVEVQVPAELDDATRAAVTALREAAAGEDPRAALFERSR